MTLCRLSREWGRPVEEIYISLDELALQIAYDKKHPPLDVRLEYMLAQLTACYVQTHVKRGKKVSPSDFMLSELMEKSEPSDLMLKNQLLRYQAQRDREKDGK